MAERVEKDLLVPGKEDLIAAQNRLKEAIHVTPVMTSENLNLLSQSDVYFKCENFQKAGAFKSRGACNAVLFLPPERISLGVCTHSSGNHAAALSRAGKFSNIPVYVVMPVNSSAVKIDAVRYYGGIITFCEPTLISREDTLKKVVQETGALEIHPYNDIRIITGQATAAMELFSVVNDLDYLIVPVGGGGLMSGTAVATHYFSPRTKVIAAEPAGADDAYRSFITGKLIPSKNPETIADGLRTSLGSLTFPIMMKYVTDVLTVSEEGIQEAMKLIWERMKIVVEPSAAVPFAAVLEYRQVFSNKKTGVILSGGNVDLQKLLWQRSCGQQ